MTKFPSVIMNVFHRTGAVEIWGRSLRAGGLDVGAIRMVAG